ncbi:hypothetical protein AGMMS4952_04380 [Spirochaetia bacterium]|nr:hypothetical protein AGMMS4952_04380 [Spirochaetia bacterium]
MKNLKFLGVLVCVLALGVMVVGCDDGSSDDGGGGGGKPAKLADDATYPAILNLP